MCGSGDDDNSKEDILSDDASENTLPSTVSLTPNLTPPASMTPRHDVELEALTEFVTYSRAPEGTAGYPKIDFQIAGANNIGATEGVALSRPQLTFDAIRFDFGKYAEEMGFKDLWTARVSRLGKASRSIDARRFP